MTSNSPPLELQRFGRSRTPESPRPVHIPEPANIPVLQNQMDPVFNDTSTYNIRRPSSQPFSPHLQDLPTTSNPSQDQSLANRETVEDFLAAAAERAQFHTPSEPILMNDKLNNGSSSSHHASADATFAYAHPINASPTASADQSHSMLNSTHAPSREASHATSPNSSAPQDHSGQQDASSIQAQLFTEALASGAGQSVNPHALANDAQASASNEEGIDYQSLLDQIAQSASTAPTAESITAPTTATSYDTAEKTLPAVPGLPPKPPPQEVPSEFSQYTNEPLRYYSLPSPTTVSPASQNQAQSQPLYANLSPGDANGENAHATAAPNGLPPPPNSAQAPSGDVARQPDFSAMFSPTGSAPGQAPRGGSTEDRAWGTDVQAVYDQFLQDERNYVTEGVWDRFPAGSRLFVGNLPSEKVTKRDLFHVFHRHGRLAQISIKQAYGFVQYLEAAACSSALNAEQGVEIRGRKIHLEISKPQRNTRNAGGGGNRATGRKRSRSPDRGVTRASADRDRLPFSDFRDEPGRKRDDYRPARSPSPRRYRSRDDYRREDRYEGYSARPRSPGYGRAPSPRAMDDEVSLPIARRAPHEVPDVQILVLEDVAQQFVAYVEQGFRQKGLRTDTIYLNPRLTLAAVVKRQIIEGVQAVVKLTRSTQFNSKIPLQVFDRTPGTTNVNFNEYVDLAFPVAADIVIQARQKERMNMQTPVSAHTPSSATYPSSQGFNGHQAYNYPQHQPPLPQQYHQTAPQPYPQPPQPHQPQYSPQQTPTYRVPPQVPPTPNSAAPNLQELLANLRQPSQPQAISQQSPIPPQNNRPTDLAGLLSNVAARQHNQSQTYSQNYAPSQPPVAQYANPTPIQGYQPQQGMHGYVAGQQQPQQNVQDVMNQLARFSGR